MIFNNIGKKMPHVSEFSIEEKEEELKCLSSNKVNPYSENYILIQKSHNENMRLQKEIEKCEAGQNKALAVLAAEIFDFSKCLNGLKAKMAKKGLEEEFGGLAILQKKMQQILKENRIEIVDLTGKILSNELLNHVKVLKYIKEKGLSEPFVKETIEPLVVRGNKLIQIGVVIVAIPFDKNGG